ncbi:MAG TPA: hypothetical protein VFE47_21925 [Tepidisphaeraceae bacterium]|jgi:hypothetical protein|nr:hypothetical protein [Tepidisphaeraceae bacterium]
MRFSFRTLFQIILLSAIWLVTAMLAWGVGRFIMHNPTAVFATRGLAFVVVLVFVLLIIPLVGFLMVQDARRRRRFALRKKMGLCVHCGYDLSGTSGRCPECGKWNVRDRMAGAQR